MTATWTLDGPPVLTRDVVRGRIAIFFPMVAATLVAIAMPTDAGVLDFATTDLGAWLVGLGAALYTVAVVGPFVRAVARHGVDRAEWERRARPATFAQGVFVSLFLPTVAAAFFLHGLAEWDALSRGTPTREEARVVAKEVHAGKGCHQRAIVAGSGRVDRLSVCVSSPSSWERVATGEALVLDVRSGAFGRVVTRIARPDGSPFESPRAAAGGPARPARGPAPGGVATPA